jgi:hypothetical protein
MKKIFSLTLCLLACAFAVSAQNDNKGLTITNHQVVVSDTCLDFSFDVEVGSRAARGGNMLIYRPWLADSTSRWSLPEIVVESRRSRIADERALWVSGEEIKFDDNARFVENGDTFRYTATIARQDWMSGAQLLAETIEVGCCSSEVNPAGLLAMMPDFLPEPVVIEKPVILVPAPTTGEMLADALPWVMPVEEFDSNLPKVMFDDDREGALTVYFNVNRFNLDPTVKGNENILDQLMTVIQTLDDAPDSGVAEIVIGGFASPEGTFALNDRLGYNRAATLREYIAANSNLDPDIIHIYNGAEDWAGLRAMVEASDMPQKQEVLDAIDNVPIWDAESGKGREAVIHAIDNGWAYRYMLDNFFPELRKAAYIKVFYENK